jgi:hypothetical protein
MYRARRTILIHLGLGRVSLGRAADADGAAVEWSERSNRQRSEILESCLLRWKPWDCAMRDLGILLGALALGSCVSTPPAAPDAAVAATPGATIETAIVVADVPEEYDYVEEHMPGWQFRQQALLPHGCRYYDVLTLEDATGARRDVYFDITDFYVAGLEAMAEARGIQVPSCPDG